MKLNELSQILGSCGLVDAHGRFCVRKQTNNLISYNYKMFKVINNDVIVQLAHDHIYDDRIAKTRLFVGNRLSVAQFRFICISLLMIRQPLLVHIPIKFFIY